MLVDYISERYWPSDPDRGGLEAQGLKEYFNRADAMVDPTETELRELAASLPNTRKS